MLRLESNVEKLPVANGSRPEKMRNTDTKKTATEGTEITEEISDRKEFPQISQMYTDTPE